MEKITVPFITGDGVGAEVTPSMQAVVNALYNFPVSNVLSDPVDIQNLVSSVYQRNGQTLL